MRYLFLIFIFNVACTNNNQQNKKEKDALEDFCSSIHRNDSVSLKKTLAPFEADLATKTGVFVLDDAESSLISRAWLSEYAESTLDVQYFIFSSDNIGLIAADYLVRAADRGIKVRVLIDDMLVDASIEDLLILDAHHKIDIKIYNPGVNLGKNIYQKVKKFAKDFRSANQRMHNKTFTVDGKICITGGRNMADEYFDYDQKYNFRDRDVLLLGKEVGKVQRSFDLFWNHKLSVSIKQLTTTENRLNPTESFKRLHQYACNPENFSSHIRTAITNLPGSFETIRNSGRLIWLDSVDFISDLPGKNSSKEGLSGGGATTTALLELVNSAKHTIDIQSPYLVTTELSRKAFKEAVARGVRVRILTNSLASTDNLEAFSGYKRDRKLILETGVRIFEFNPNAANRYASMPQDLKIDSLHKPVFGLHAKSMVVDGRTTVVGTFNLDPRSANLNTECITIIHSQRVAEIVQKQMEEEFLPENAWETTLNYNPDAESSLKKRVGTTLRKIIPKGIL